jgi:lipid-binding SYLF domain-containing protein
MSGHQIKLLMIGLIMLASTVAALPRPAHAESALQINQQVDSALSNLYANTPAAVELSKKAVAILVFPSVVKAGFIFGGEYGTGGLRENNQPAGYYSIAAASYGLQIGVQSFGYALFLMNNNAMNFLNGQGGWQVGVGPSVVIMNQGMARSFTTATELQDVYAFIFDQQGLMAGMGLQGSKITPYTPDF